MTKTRTPAQLLGLPAQLLGLHARLLVRMDREYGRLWPLPEILRCLDPLTLRCVEQTRRLYESEVRRAQNPR